MSSFSSFETYRSDCKWCGKPHDWSQRSHAQFCSIECKNKWHNERRKLARQVDKVQELIEAISYNDARSVDELRMIMHTLKVVPIYANRYVCAKCDLPHNDVPSLGELCRDCQSDTWVLHKRDYDG